MIDRMRGLVARQELQQQKFVEAYRHTAGAFGAAIEDIRKHFPGTDLEIARRQRKDFGKIADLEVPRELGEKIVHGFLARRRFVVGHVFEENGYAIGFIKAGWKNNKILEFILSNMETTSVLFEHNDVIPGFYSEKSDDIGYAAYIGYLSEKNKVACDMQIAESLMRMCQDIAEIKPGHEYDAKNKKTISEEDTYGREFSVSMPMRGMGNFSSRFSRVFKRESRLETSRSALPSAAEIMAVNGVAMLQTMGDLIPQARALLNAWHTAQSSDSNVARNVYMADKNAIDQAGRSIEVAAIRQILAFADDLDAQRNTNPNWDFYSQSLRSAIRTRDAQQRFQDIYSVIQNVLSTNNAGSIIEGRADIVIASASALFMAQSSIENFQKACMAPEDARISAINDRWNGSIQCVDLRFNRAGKEAVLKDQNGNWFSIPESRIPGGLEDLSGEFRQGNPGFSVVDITIDNGVVTTMSGRRVNLDDEVTAVLDAPWDWTPESPKA